MAAPAEPDLTGLKVLLGVSGGVAAYKAASLARGLLKQGAEVQVILTHGATRFVQPAQFAALTGRPAHTDTWDEVHRIIHVEVARWADVAIFAPATTNLVAKFAHGIADDLVTSAYTCLTIPTVIAPAMHTEMWEHPATQAAVRTLAERGDVIVGPDEGQLAGGDVGPGRLADEADLLAAVARAAGRDGGGPLAGRRVVVTAGGTREAIDPVRFLGNRSSGRMGHAIADEAAAQGARVTLVTTAELPAHPAVEVVRVESALQMHGAVMDAAGTADVIVKAAAVADFRPQQAAGQKLKKADGVPQIALVPNPDILAELGAREDLAAVLVGFAAETTDVEAHGAAKLARKGADLIVINDVSQPDAGFSVSTNRGVILAADGERIDVPLTSKRELARILLDAAARRLPDQARADSPDGPGRTGGDVAGRE